MDYGVSYKYRWLFLYLMFPKIHDESNHLAIIIITLSQRIMAVGPAYNYYELTLIPAWISKHIIGKILIEIIYLFQIFNSCADEIWEWTSNFIPQFIMYVLGYPWWDQNQ